MRQQAWLQLGIVVAAIFIVGCRSTRLEISTYPGSTPKDETAKILGLPLMGGGLQLDAANRRQLEQEIDESLGTAWTEQYIPISEVRSAHKAALLPWVKGMAGNSDLASRLRISATQCRTLGEATGCRYAVLPVIGKCASAEANRLNIGYVIPAGMVVIYGTIPVFLGQYEIEDLPVWNMTLIDLDAAQVVGEVLWVTRNQTVDPAAAIPEALIKGVIRADRILQARKP